MLARKNEISYVSLKCSTEERERLLVRVNGGSKDEGSKFRISQY